MILSRALAAALLLWTSLPAWATIPFKQEKQSDGDLAFQSLGALVLAGLIAYGAVLGLKHMVKRGVASKLVRARKVKTVESTRLGKDGTLHVVEYDGDELLIGATSHGVQVLSRKPLPPQEAPDA